MLDNRQIEFRQARAKYYLTAVHRVMIGTEAFRRVNLLGKKELIPTGIPYRLAGQIESGPQCVTVPIQLGRSADFKTVMALGDRFAIESRSSFARVYRYQDTINVEFTLPAEQWIEVKFSDLIHRAGQATIGEQSLGGAIRLSFEKSPHKLISGETQTGKTTCETAMVMSLVKKYTREEIQFLILNPKNESSLNKLARLPHLARKIAVDYQDCAGLLRYALGEMEMRRFNEERRQCRLVVLVDEVKQLCEVAPETSVAISQLMQFAGSLRINVVLGTQNPIPSTFGERGAQILANVGGYIVFRLANQYAYYATGGQGGVRTGDLGMGGDGKGDGLAVSDRVSRFRGALPKERDFEMMPHLDGEPPELDEDDIPGNRIIEIDGMKWSTDDLADRAGYGLALVAAGVKPSIYKYNERFGGNGTKHPWLKTFVARLQERTTYWGQEVKLLEGGKT